MSVETWAAALAALVLVYLALLGALLLAGRGALARELALLVPNLLLLFRGLIGDARVPRRAKLVLGIAALWIASPIDLVPDFLPVIGPLDDAIVAALALRYVLRAAPRDIMRAHWRGDPATLDRILRLAGGSSTPTDAPFSAR